MTNDNRLAQMKKYLEEALIDPIANKLYIEDLQLSIAHFEKYVPSMPETKVEVMSGFAIDS